MGMMLSLIFSLVAIAGPLATSALAVPCNQNEVTQVTATPDSDRNVQGTNHSVTVEVRNGANQVCQNVLVDFNITGANPQQFESATDANGLVTFTWTGTNAGTDNYEAFVEQVDNDTLNPGEPNDTGDKDFVTENSLVLDVTPETDNNPTGTSHSMTANVSSAEAGGGGVAGVEVDFEIVSGPQTNFGAGSDFSCTAVTDANGNCTGTYSETADGVPNEAGTDIICGWIDDLLPATGPDDLYNPGGAAGATADSQQDGQACDEETQPTDTFTHTDLVAKTWDAQVATTINCSPETDTNTIGQQHTFTCNVHDQAGNNMQGVEVDGEITGGPHDSDAGATAPSDFSGSTTDAGGNVTYSYTPASGTGTDAVCFWIDDNADNQIDPPTSNCGEALGDAEYSDATDVVNKTWNAPAAPARLEVTLELDANPVSTPHVWTAHVLDNTNAHVGAGVVIHAEVTGAGDPDANNTPATPDRTCTTDATGHCDFASVTSATPGSTTLTAWIDTDANPATPNHDASEGRVSSNSTDCLTGEGEPAALCSGTATPGAAAEPDTTDVVQKNWHTVAQTLTMTPDSDSAATGTCNVFTITLLDQAGNPVGGAVIDVEQIHADFGPPDPPTPPALDFCDSGEVATADPAAPNPSGVDAALGDLGGGANGDVGGESFNDGVAPGTTGVTNGAGQLSFGVESAGTGNVQVTAFCENQAGLCPGTTNDDPDPNEPQDVSTKTWTAGGAQGVTSLDCEPETDSNPENTSHTFQCTATNAQAQPVAGVPVNFDVTAGPNAGSVGVDTPCGNTNASGVATCTYADAANSPAAPNNEDTIVGYVNQSPPNGSGPGPQTGEPQDEVKKAWTPAPSGLIINLFCVGAAIGDDGDLNDLNNEFDAPQGDCTNPAEPGNESETFTALVTNPNGTATTTDDTPVAGIQVLMRTATGGDCGGCGKSPNDASQTIGGTPDGPVFCTTAADGTCSINISNASPANGEFFDVFAEIFGQTNDAPQGNDEDVATKVWSTRIVKRITLTPQTDTNQNNTQHTVTGTVVDQFNTPMAGKNVDFRITAGRNIGVTDFDNTTDAAGQVTFTYTDSGPALTAGQDTIKAWVDILTENDVDNDPDAGDNNANTVQNEEPDGSAVKNWQPDAPTTSSVQIDMETNDGDSDVGDGCGNTAAPTSATAWDAAATPNNINVNDNSGAANIHPLCAAAFQANGTPNTNGTFDFTLTGPGQFTDATGTQNLGNSLTGVALDQAGHAHVWIKSTVTGTSTVVATHGGQSDTGTKQWQNQPANARNVVLCHGDVVSATCDPNATNEPGEEHEMTVKVTDVYGNPVPNAPITWAETGTGTFLSTQNTTDANGEATAILISSDEGTSTVTASITGAGPGSECAETANNPFTGAPAGNCSDSVTKTWEDQPDPVPACSDGADNDGDTFVDEDDPGCLTPDGNYDPDDDSEEPANDPVDSGPCQGYAEGSTNDSPVSAGKIIVGTDGPDLLAGTDGDDIICGLGGDDVISSGGGEDIVVGNGGADTVNGGGGKDQLKGNGGDDAVSGKGNNDTVLGGGGDDTLKGNKGFDTLKGQDGNDTVQGGEGQDIVTGNAGNDTLKGWTEVDNLNGGPGNDDCDGGPPKGDGDKFTSCESKVNG